MNTQQAIELASGHLKRLKGRAIDVLTITRPSSVDAANNLVKVVSKLSPILGNLIEFNTVEFLNTLKEFTKDGSWIRQDPGFPDALFRGKILPAPGFEIKAWFPLATEITARFKDSQCRFLNDEIYVVMLAWLPDHLIFGTPQIVDVGIFSGLSVAKARDNHYHNPPDYLVLEPEDTSARTSNLQQTNTNGYKWQGTDENEKKAAVSIVDSWGKDARQYSPSRKYQARLRELIARFPYRLDTNFAKMDRIAHEGIEAFKTKVATTMFHGKTMSDWSKLFSNSTPEAIEDIFLHFK